MKGIQDNNWRWQQVWRRKNSFIEWKSLIWNVLHHALQVNRKTLIISLSHSSALKLLWFSIVKRWIHWWYSWIFLSTYPLDTVENSQIILFSTTKNNNKKATRKWTSVEIFKSFSRLWFLVWVNENYPWINFRPTTSELIEYSVQK